MIGYYVHHVGRGHVHLAAAVAEHLPAVTILSSLPRPSGWRHRWVELPRDDVPTPASDVDAGGRLHWAPLGHSGYRTRMTAIAQWVAEARPTVLVVDVSVEVTALGRLLGVPVITTALPGARDDPAHQLGYDLATAVIAPWPDLGPGTASGLDRHRRKVHYVGGVSRFDGRAHVRRSPDESMSVVRLGGAGGRTLAGDAPALPPGWRWTDLTPGSWVDDPWPALCTADVVVTHCGLGALADVAAAGRPAVLVPEDRPHGEQRATARALAGAGIGVVCDEPPREWVPVLRAAMDRGGDRWSAWRTRDAARRAAGVVLAVVGATPC